MINFDKNEFLKPQIYSTLDEYETRCNVTKEIIEEIEQLQQENKKYKEVIDKLNNKINLLKTCEDKHKEDIIYPHWEICNETKQELLEILKGE